MEENKIKFVNNLLITAGDAILKIYNTNDFKLR
jgi:hypothetical protein